MTTLNEEQQAAVDSDAPRRLVAASPGSGKTRLLVAAVAREAKEHGASGCVVLTFTNASALVMQQRLEEMGVTGIGFIGTIHSFLYRCLTEHHFGQTFSIVDNDAREAIVESVMADLGVKGSLDKMIKHIDEDAPMPKSGKVSKIDCVALEYELRLQSSNLVDFKGILSKGARAVELLHAAGRWSYNFLAIDEAQDCSQTDWNFIATAPFERSLIVGDGDQCIYQQLRGAKPEYFVKLAEAAVHPKIAPENRYELFLLQDNYRSGPNICGVAQVLIQHNKNRVDKQTISARTDIQGTVTVHRCETPAAELSYVLETLHHEAVYNLREPKDCAVLCRTNRAAKEFATHLAANGVPVATVEQPRRPSDWKRAKLLLTVLANPWNDMAVESFMRACCDDRMVNAYKTEAAKKLCGLNEAQGFPFGKGDASIDVDLAKHGLSPESRELIHAAARELSRRGEWSINELVLFLGQQDSMARTVGEGVTVCTGHASKGREFDVVFLPGIEEGTLPSAKDLTTPEATEESRRLLFVMLTRAKSRLVLTWSASRPEYRGEALPPGPLRERQRSRFLTEAGI